jgi:hypothetical protein
MRFLLALCLLIGVVPASAAEDPQRKAQIACGVSAATDYNKAKLALLTQSPLSVGVAIAERRLEESYCLRFAKCMIDDASGLPFAAVFSSCLEDEALEKYEAARVKK